MEATRSPTSADGEDVIDLSLLDSISGFDDLSAIPARLVRCDRRWSGHGGGTIALENFDIEDLDETDFVF